MNYLKTIAYLEHRLQLPLPGQEAQERMLARVRPLPSAIPDNARPSAVMILLFPVDGRLMLLLIQRTEDGRAHSGQISFPGGKQDPSDADLRATALREAQEEVGIMSQDVRFLGELTPLYIPVSNFMVYPFVAFAETRPEYLLSKNEVARVLELDVTALLAADLKTVARVTSPADRSFVRRVNAYQLDDGSIIWGATAMILSELEVILAERFSAG